jgi:hypothetical protein
VIVDWKKSYIGVRRDGASRKEVDSLRLGSLTHSAILICKPAVHLEPKTPQVRIEQTSAPTKLFA